MHTITCPDGDSYAAGFVHGKEAATSIGRCIAFYEKLFLTNSKLSWEEVCQIALKFMPFLEKNWPHFVNELQGVASGSAQTFPSILALNVRTEVAYGMFNDGCTSLSWHRPETTRSGASSYLAQTWDWNQEQSENLIRLRIHQSPKPSIDMITEAGIIGKIGLNSAGVGVCLNAVRARGVDFQKLPCHLALRAVLDSETAREAQKTLYKAGVASSCYILIGDEGYAAGLECSHLGIEICDARREGDVEIISHTNHYLKQHPGVEESIHLPDSIPRLERIDSLVVSEDLDPTPDGIFSMLQDEQGYPASICRDRTDESTVATLFSIVMSLDLKTATVWLNRPVDRGECLILEPEAKTLPWTENPILVDMSRQSEGI